VIAYSPGSGNSPVEQRPTPASPGNSLTTARHAFRIWRRTRPFWGGLLVIVGASEMLVSERDPLPVVTHIGTQGLAGYLIPTFILVCGVLLWSIPDAWIYYSLFAILLGLGSWITSNLGGFFIGMLIDVIGGALAFAWTTDADYGSSGWLRGKPPSGLPSWALDVISRLKERSAPQSEGHGEPTDSPGLAEPTVERSQRAAHPDGPKRPTTSTRQRAIRLVRPVQQLLSSVVHDDGDHRRHNYHNNR
jgi:hypothetical protein